VISYDDFWDTYQPRPNPRAADGDNNMLWQWPDVETQPVHHVWTLVSGDDGTGVYASPGYHIVNREGYVVTEQPWTDDTEDAVWSEED
jgi:hypothetical protein